MKKSSRTSSASKAPAQADRMGNRLPVTPISNGEVGKKGNTFSTHQDFDIAQGWGKYIEDCQEQARWVFRAALVLVLGSALGFFIVIGMTIYLKEDSSNFIAIMGTVVTELCGVVMFRFHKDIQNRAGDLWQKLERMRGDAQRMQEFSAYIDQITNSNERDERIKQMADIFLHHLLNDK